MKARLKEAVKETVEKATSEAGDAQKALIEDAVNKAMKRLDPRDMEEKILCEVKAMEAQIDDRTKGHSGRIAFEFRGQVRGIRQWVGAGLVRQEFQPHQSKGHTAREYYIEGIESRLHALEAVR